MTGIWFSFRIVSPEFLMAITLTSNSFSVIAVYAASPGRRASFHRSGDTLSGPGKHVKAGGGNSEGIFNDVAYSVDLLGGDMCEGGDVKRPQ